MTTSHSNDRKSLLIVGFGYLGQRVAREAVAKGYRVFATSRRPEKRERIEAAGCEFVAFDINADSGVLPSADRWVWCPAFDRSAGVSVRDFARKGLERALIGTKSVPEAVVFTSTTGVYHQQAGEWVDETSPCEPTGDSGRAHVEAESWLLEWAHKHDRTAIVLRLSGLYGPGRTIRRQAIEAGEPIACHPDTWLNLVHIDDAARACLMALDRNESGVYCVTDDRPILRREFYAVLARILGAPAPTFVEPVAGDFGGNKRVSNRRIKEQLGWQPLFNDVVEGLQSDLA